jgi:hypothetical protein
MMMESTDERAQRGHFMADVNAAPNDPRTIPIIQTPLVQTTAPSPSDPMEVTPSPSAMAPPDTNGIHEHMGMADQPSSGSLAGPSAAAAAAAGAQQPKVVQTAFIHKLYKYASSLTRCEEFRADYLIACSKIPTFST